MTQWKEKTSNDRDNIERQKLGLFSYPVLQAADVLVHRATHVPVGHDQAQHLEFARELAIGFNHVFGEGVLVPPETLISPAKRIMSLTQPTAKMSKSASNEKSRIMLTDSEEVIRAKVKAAVTDSQAPSITYDLERRPGVSNLIDILYHCSEQARYANQEALARELNGSSFKSFKNRVTDALEGLIKPIRERYSELRTNDKLLREVADEGTTKASQNAKNVLGDVKHAVGLM